MKALADYVHAKGLKIGIYSSPGPKTCAGYEGSYGHEEQDAHTFAEWGIDFVKYDWCSAFRIYSDSEMRAVYQKMGDALRESGRPMVYSLCQYGKNDVWKWGKLVGGNLWRTTGDIEDNAHSMFSNAEAEVDLAPWAEPGHWNDPDMLEIGNGGMSADEYRTHMTFWSILAAPLIAGNDLRNMTPETRAILTNSEVIAINQDVLGRQGHRVQKHGNIEIWTRPLAGGAVALAIFNLGVPDTSVTVGWQALGISNMRSVRDPWARHDLPAAMAEYSGTIKSHGAELLRLETGR
jgi:alpha-galactosidase